ncbi:ubiquinol-cytochrome C chaperone family protein [Martelella endophytica]|uniref:Ubiquinol-cytochrome C chaperone n=1 Tax=Martelella endophytica TaxID=1486262 RepID=A0A0D5LUC7_MAREN|nr:ubiquinol-cytochrome C chaperone family protein [Martelella endophytica]AJY47671.1 ubiquinol-cytochrome C chaperone [Martelella endophytica]
MVLGFFSKRRGNRLVVERQYGVITTTARQPCFYTHYHVPDTVMGRFEMLSAVMILFLRRTANSGAGGKGLAQEIVDAFFMDIDYSIRELGVGDNSVPKRMKKLAGMFYGRLERYARCLEDRDLEQLSIALAQNIHSVDADHAEMADLARWMLENSDHLSRLDEIVVETGMVSFLVPESIEVRRA